jgi:CheY-like chemotaxis protein
VVTSPRLLLVEDNTALERILTLHLSRLGFQVTSAGTGEDALALLRGNALVPDVLVTDIMLPGMTGLELALQLRDRFPQLPSVLITAYPPEFLAKHGVRLGEFPLLNKPFGIEDLRRVMTELLGYVLPTPA